VTKGNTNKPGAGDNKCEKSLKKYLTAKFKTEKNCNKKFEKNCKRQKEKIFKKKLEKNFKTIFKNLVFSCWSSLL
jgi:hypothetical protein